MLPDSSLHHLSLGLNRRVGTEESSPGGVRILSDSLNSCVYSLDDSTVTQRTVDLLVPTKVTGIITQGAKDFGHVQFVGSYKLAYSNDGEHWTVYQDEKQRKDKADVHCCGNVSHMLWCPPGSGAQEPPVHIRQYQVLGPTIGSVQSQPESVVHHRVFQGNFDNDTHRKNVIDPPIYARHIRILPWSWYGRITLRSELLGCTEEE
ncbi:hypothetical protein CB1_000373004 [Camelus ferus]|nr:hypothetical protein CB1_000373004 [Camelus ferus]